LLEEADNKLAGVGFLERVRRQWSAQAKPRKAEPADEISKHRRKSAADLPAGSGAAGSCADGGLYMPVENRAAHAGGIGRVPPLALHRSLLSRGAAVCHGRTCRKKCFCGQIVAEAINFPVKLVSLSPALHVLELFSRPTLAFKDFGGAVMARLMGYFCARRIADADRAGGDLRDTGSAVAHGFTRAGNSRCILYLESASAKRRRSSSLLWRKHYRTRSLRQV